MNEFSIEALPNTFRIKKLNAIEVLALKTTLKFDTIDNATKSFNSILEIIEIQFDGNWLPVKEKGRDIYYPVTLADNFEAVKQLVEYVFGTYLKQVF